MKRSLKNLLLFVLCLVWLSLFCVSASAEEGVASAECAFAVERTEEGYLLRVDADGGGCVGVYETLAELLAGASERESAPTLRLLDVTVDEPTELSFDCTLYGSVAFLGEVSVAHGAEVTFADADIALSSSLRIKDASVRVEGARIECLGASAVVMDYSPLSSLEIHTGSLRSEGAPAIRITTGSLLMTGGCVSSASGVAISSTVGLTLTGAAEISGVGADLYAERPISLSFRGESFLGELTILTDAVYEKGEGTPVVWGADADMVGRITLVDREGVAEPLKYFEEAPFSAEKHFLAVAKPYTVRYFVRAELWCVEEYYRGQTVSHPEAPQLDGFRFAHFGGEEGGTPLGEITVEDDTEIYAVYRLLPPTFSLGSLCFSYDGTAHAWGPENLSHPLLGEGHLSFVWRREGEVLASSADTLLVREVKESGSYTLSVTFTYRGESATTTSAPVTLAISKKRIAPPSIAPKSYTGTPLFAEVVGSGDYVTRQNGGGTDAGEYPVLLSLTDPENTAWEGNGAEVLTLYFRIERAENAWIGMPTVADVFYGRAPVPSAHARFGSVRFLFCDREDGVYREEAPRELGTYYVKAVVDASANYEGLEGVPIGFSIMENRVVSLRVERPPKKTEYTAFEVLDLDGAVLMATYLDGSTAPYPTDEIVVKYATASAYLLAGDTYAVLMGDGVEVVLALEVERARYEVDDIRLIGASVIYSGERQSLSFTGILPTGLDGIPLCASVTGGGTDVGEYEITLSFSTESDNYDTPSPRRAILKILPMPVKAEWNIPTFVYDGSEKVPTASFTDAFGRVQSLSVTGGAIPAGEGYVAVARVDDKNYELENPTAAFCIQKGSYDTSSVRWVGDGFVYDATEKRVYLVGLPSGVSVVAYADASAVGAGEYTARATLSYDSENYNEPRVEDYAWCIAKAAYSTDGFSFVCDDVVYNGEVQYPSLVGAMPVGLDGSRLSFSFDRGVRDVCEGVVRICARFSTDSKNYEAPAPVSLSLRVLPLGVSVSWTELSFVYDGSRHLPSASYPDLALRLSGGGVDAGEYTAFCTSLDPNYTVVNERIAFSVERAANLWLCPLSAPDVYESGAPRPVATPMVGEVVYRFFSDALGEREIDRPRAVGTYYVRAEVPESKNYLALCSSILSFCILEVTPECLVADLSHHEFLAFERVPDDVLSVFVLYNDGTRESVTPEIRYPSGDSLCVTDREVTLVWGPLSLALPVTVRPARADLSSVVLSEASFVYDGEAHTPTLLGLPSGVTVASILGGEAITAGVYELEVILEYDRVNYEEIPPLRFCYTVEKRRVPTPTLAALVFDGRVQGASVPPSDDYTVAKVEEGRGVGRYAVELLLTDPDNTAFADAEGSALTVYFEILPRPITVRMSDLTLYRDGASAEVRYSIVEGVLLEGDTLTFTPVLDGSVGAVFDAPNYSVTVIEGELVKTDRLSPEGRERVALFVVLVVIVLLLLALALFFYQPLLSRYRYRRTLTEPVRPATVPYLCAPVELSPVAPPMEEEVQEACTQQMGVGENAKEEYPEEKDEDWEAMEEASVTVAIDEGRADRLMRDESAKEMIGKESEAVFTYGRRHSIINVDTLSDNFSPGERVDVNLLKERSLIPYDTGYLKVLARGCIDKPLFVYANDFSLSAVKMLLLSGGTATRVRTACTPKGAQKKK